MAATLNNSPIYDDTRTAGVLHNVWYLLWGSFGIIAGLTVAVVVLATRPQKPGYVLEVNSHGWPVGKIEPATSMLSIPDVATQRELIIYLDEAFRIDTSPLQEQNLGVRLAAMSTPAVADQLRAWYQVNNPLKLGQQFTRTVDVLNMLRDGQDTYRVHYRLHTYKGSQDTVTFWWATLHVIKGQPIDNNGYGIFVDSFDWHQEES